LGVTNDELDKIAERLLAVLPDLRDDVESLVSDLQDAWADAEAQDRDHANEVAELCETLETVKYWFHDVMVLGKPPSDPRKMLRTVEDALIC
jgi:hypothetical protein